MLPILNLRQYHQGAILTHLLELDDESRRLRFGIIMSDAKIIKFIKHINWDQDGIYGIFNNDYLLVGFAHAANISNIIRFGVSVLPEYQKRGYGTQLFDKTVLFARNHLNSKITMHCIKENLAIIKIAEKKGMKLIPSHNKIDAYLELPPLTSTSLTEEYIQDSFSQFDSAVKQSVLRFNFFSKGISSLYFAYVNSFITKSLKKSGKKPTGKPNNSEKISTNTTQTESKPNTSKDKNHR